MQGQGCEVREIIGSGVRLVWGLISELVEWRDGI